MAKVLIRDGMTKSGTVKAMNGCGEVKFTYRPALTEAVCDYQISAARAGNGAERMRSYASILIPHLQSWDIDADNGNSAAVAKIDAATLNRVPAFVLIAMIDCITGYSDEEVGADLKK